MDATVVVLSSPSAYFRAGFGIRDFFAARLELLQSGPTPTFRVQGLCLRWVWFSGLRSFRDHEPLA